MYIRVAYGEIGIARKIKAVGGTWNREKKLWELPYKYVGNLKFIDRIIE